MVAGLSEAERGQRIAAIAAGISHWAIPAEEQLHLIVTAHHGHAQGARKCSGDKALCARCLSKGVRTEEHTTHEHHSCPEAAAPVWAA